MTESTANPSTGLPSLDGVLQGLNPGDNVVWQVDTIDNFRPLADAYLEKALEEKRRIVYFRFAKHEPLVPEDSDIQICRVGPESFESFIAEIHRVIGEAGKGAYYIFDCLSELVVDWYSDQMLGNFFMLTCPYLYDLDTITYFALLRNRHSVDATIPILNTTQIMVDVFKHRERLYIHPLKVDERYSPSIFMLHVCEGNEYQPITQSVAISEDLAEVAWTKLESNDSQRGYWDRTFEEAGSIQEALGREEVPTSNIRYIKERLLRMLIAREGRVFDLADRYLDLSDMLEIRRRMIGTGLIGGKAVGMLLARAVLKEKDARWVELLENHDSFYIGADVFYTFLVQNRLWWIKLQQNNPEHYLEELEISRKRIMEGQFPEPIINRFMDMLDYFGQSPIIVRSSSLLEDSFGNAFSGKYESVFCTSQGSRTDRLEEFITAVRTVYASAMAEDALRYRSARGLLHRDEQMPILVQRVSGAVYDSHFFPQVAGVGLSHNPFVWDDNIDPRAGIVRLVFGLGTRAVNRVDDDYTRVVALNEPNRRPEAGIAGAKRYAQRKVDLLDLESKDLNTHDFVDVAQNNPDLPIQLFASRDTDLERLAKERGMKNVFPWFLTFDHLLKNTSFVEHMRDMLSTLEDTYQHPVDVEFTTNFLPDGTHKINLVQCRPLQIVGGQATDQPFPELSPDLRVLETAGPIIGHGRRQPLDRIIYVVPSLYGQMPISDRYSIARTIGHICHVWDRQHPPTTMLLGPGRWGTASPELGVPVSFAEIDTVSAICEVVAMRDDLIPDVSLGTHFFNDLVENDILYLVLFPERKNDLLSRDFFEKAPNQLAALLPEAEKWADIIRVIDLSKSEDERNLFLHASTTQQQVMCYWE